MKIFTRILTLTTVFLMANGMLHQAYAQRIIGYMPSWAGDANAIQYSKLTHINYAFALPNSDGSIKPIDNPAKLQTIVTKAHAVGTKVLIAVGGWSDNGVILDPTFEALAGNATSRSRFITACMSLVNTYGLDGVDIDWEYPDAGQSSTNFDLLMTGLSDQLKPQGKLLTAAVIGNGATGGGVSATVFAKVDWLNIMSYDANDFQHSTYDYSLQCLSYWSGRGLAKSKISLGVPFYGRPSWESYAALVGRGADPNADVFSNVGYNGLVTIRRKTQYVKDNAYGGMMIWELSQDLGNQNSLLSAMYAITGGTTPPPPPPPTQSPYGGTAAAIPGKVEAERYDLGGQTIAFSDNTAGNSGAAFRTDDVDVEATTDAGAGHNIGYTAAGEWLEYTVNVTAGTYKMEVRVAATVAGKSLHVEMNGTNIGNISVPNTGGWQNWQTVTINNISMTAGQKVMRVYFDTDGINLNYVNFASGTTPPNQFPSVNITGPANNTNYTAPASVNITANATDADGTISKVDFYNGATLLGTDNTSPYNFSWTNVAAGSYSLTARATDNSGAVTTSGAVTIVVNPSNPTNQPPTVSITGPANNSSYTAPASVNITANAADANGTVSKVDFYNGGTLIGTDNTAPYSFSWTNVAAGTYSLTARATDNAGAATTSAAVTIVVNPVSSGCSTPAWSASAIYVAGNRVSKNGTIYEAKWWTQGDDPLLSGQWDVWKTIGACNAKIGMFTDNDVNTSNYISVSPNPSNGFLQIHMNTIDASSIEIQLFDSFGHEVFSANGIGSGETINIQSLAAGIYVMKIRAGEQVLTQRLVRQ